MADNSNLAHAFHLITGGEVYTPAPIGRKDILISAGKIIQIGDNLQKMIEPWATQIINGDGLIVVPGLIDQHLHLTGGGGIWGPESRSPNMPFSAISSAGVTCVVGCLGADNITRQMPELLIVTSALEHQGISAFAYTGGYHWPLPTVTGEVGKDVALIDRILGVKIAISEPRGNPASVIELIRVAAESYLAGQVAGKAGIIHVHVGDGPEGFKPLTEVIDKSGIPAGKFVVTHVNRSQRLLEESVKLGRDGVLIDITTMQSPELGKQAAIKPSQAVNYLLEEGVPLERITFSSDSGASVLISEGEGRKQKRRITTPERNLHEVRDLVKHGGVPLEQVLCLVTINPARILGLDKQKGSIAVGLDADLTILTHDLDVHTTLSKGESLVQNGKPIVWGPFEN